MQAQNPVIRDQFSADPTARVFNNKVYLYPSHDIVPPEGQRLDWFCLCREPDRLDRSWCHCHPEQSSLGET